MVNRKNRIVVTGLGVVSSIGIGWQAFWKNLIAGKSGISRISLFDSSGYERHFAGEIKDFSPEDFISSRKVNQIGRASQLAIAASKLALQDAGLKLTHGPHKNIGVCIGTTMGESQVVEQLNQQYFPLNKTLEVDSLSALTYPASAIPTNVAKELQFCGPNVLFGNACAAGNYALADAFELVRSGRVDYMFAGGADAFSRIAFTGFSRLFAVAPEKCQPFDKNRKGMIPGEGAGMLVLESLESAQKRKAKIYAEILGYGLSCDAHHMTAPDTQGVERAMQKALIDSGVDPKDIDYISAHGTGTIENDKTECAVYRRILGNKYKKTPISSIKSMLGHTMGAASALESVACCLSMDQNEVPPTINYEEEDPICDIDCVPLKGRRVKVDIALNSSQAFGGNNACIVFNSMGKLYES